MQEQMPDVEVRISDVMRALFHGRATHAETSLAPPLEAGPKPAPLADADWRDVVLRRDGAKPLRFRGLKVITASHQTFAGGQITLNLYIGPTAELYAHCTVWPSATLSAREVMVGQKIESAPEMDRFLDQCAPIACVYTHPAADARTLNEQGEAIKLLQQSYQDLIATSLPQSRYQPRRSIQ